MELGAQLAREHPCEADIVIGVPDSATAAAVGYARESGIPFAEALVKNRYVGRTFIMPDQRIRDQGAHLKYNALREVLEGQRVIVVDDTHRAGDDDPPRHCDAARSRRKRGPHARDLRRRLPTPASSASTWGAAGS